MASLIGHTLIGVEFASAAAYDVGVSTSPALCLAAIVASNLPDLDLFGMGQSRPQEITDNMTEVK